MMEATSQQRKFYLNRAQQESLAVAANVEVDIASRRFGKSFGIIAPRIVRNFQAMPGSTGCFVASSFKQAHTRTLPAALKGLEDMGYHRDVHYVVGHRPPPSLGFAKPLITPNCYDDIISFYNGSCIMIVSQDVKMSSNSATFDYVIGDEAKGLDWDKLKDETLPANGGSRRWFQDCPWHHGLLWVSDMPVDKEGRWLLNYREKMDKDVIDAILGILWELKDLRDNHPDDVARADALRSYLQEMRRIAVYYREWDIFENIDVVGLDYVKQMKRDLPPLVFNTSIMSRRIERLHDGFYPAYRANIHTYIANNNKPLLDAGYDFADHDYGCLTDADLNLDRPICIAFDYNANINWLVAGQTTGDTLKVVKSFYVKYERKLRELIDDFCHYYRYQRCKEVIYYYDSTAIGGNYAVAKDSDYAHVVQEQFTRNGWTVRNKYIGKQMRHSDKYELINDAFNGAKHLMPLFNKENNEALLMSIALAEVTIDRNGFQKCKAGEKLVENEDDPLEYRTDGSDAFDTLLIGTSLYPYNGGVAGFGSSVR